MLTINEKPPAFASRAIGILEGHIAFVRSFGPCGIQLTTDDGTVIFGSVQTRAKKAILADPSVLQRRVRCLVYPRTVQTKITIQIVDFEPADDESPQKDLFLIQGWNLGSRTDKLAQIGIRPNRRTKHQYERFWLSLHGSLKDNLKCVYQVKAIRKGARLFIIQSDPQLPKGCQIQREKRSSHTRRTGLKI